MFPTPDHLTLALVIATVLPLLVGAINQLVQSKLIFGQWPLPSRVLPYLTTLGSFLTGCSTYVASQAPFNATGAAFFMMGIAGAYSLLVGALPAAVAHLHGAAVNVKRPPPETTDATLDSAKRPA